MESCEKKSSYKPTDWNEIEKYKQEAKAIASAIEPRLVSGEKLSWNSLKAVCGMNATLWKLLLKEFRFRGYDIGDYKNKYVFKHNKHS